MTTADHGAFNRRASHLRLAELESTLALHEQREESKLAELIEKIDGLKNDVAEVSEVLRAWNNAKGFVQTIQALAKVVTVLALCAAPFVAFGYYLKTGQWRIGG